MKWHFPLINPVKKFSLKHFFDHVHEELDEFKEEKAGSIEQAKEVVDILHAAETLVRKYFEKYPQHSFERIKESTTIKNHIRGYYTK